MAKRGLEERNSDLGLPLEVILGKLIGALENVPDRIDSQQKCINQIKTDLKLLSEKDIFHLKEKLSDLEENLLTLKKAISSINELDDNQKDHIEDVGESLVLARKEVDKKLEDLSKRIKIFEDSKEKKAKTKKEIIIWILKKIGVVIAAGLTAWVTVKVKGG